MAIYFQNCFFFFFFLIGWLFWICCTSHIVVGLGTLLPNNQRVLERFWAQGLLIPVHSWQWKIKLLWLLWTTRVVLFLTSCVLIEPPLTVLYCPWVQPAAIASADSRMSQCGGHGLMSDGLAGFPWEICDIRLCRRRVWADTVAQGRLTDRSKIDL